MKIELIKIEDRGNKDKERLHFKVLSDIDLSHYAILDSSYTEPTRILAGQRPCYWFSPKKITAGNHVVVYSGTGKPSDEDRGNGITFHFLFRGSPTPLYSSPDACAVMLEIENWNTIK